MAFSRTKGSIRLLVSLVSRKRSFVGHERLMRGLLLNHANYVQGLSPPVKYWQALQQKKRVSRVNQSGRSLIVSFLDKANDVATTVYCGQADVTR